MATAFALPAEESAETRENRVIEAAQQIISPLAMLAEEQVRAKAPIEDRWLRNLRQYLGIYEPKTLAKLVDAGQSRAFVKLTRHKTNGWSARIGDLLFPTDSKNWGIEPTPIPKLSAAADEARRAAIAKVEEANKAADAGDPTADQIAAEAGEFAEQIKQHESAIAEAGKRCDWMERTIEDQLVEADYVAECRDVIEDGCKIGTGILKGPTTANQLRPRWSQDGDGRWVLAQDPDPRPMYSRIDPWHFFPDMSARTIREAEFTFERSLPTKKDLRRAALKLGFNKDAVRRLLKAGPSEIVSENLSHIAELRALTGEQEQIKGRYIQWEYHGPLDCRDIATLLRAAGREEEADDFEQNKDELEEYRVIIHFIGNEVLKIAPEYPLDSGESLYSVWNFEKGETSIFGIGVPEIMSDSQDSLNIAWRMMLDNSALSVGPQLVFDKGAITPQDGHWGLKPLKVWLRSSTSYASPTNRPFDQFEVTNNQKEMAGIIEIAKAFADEETSMPDIAQGEQGAATQTAGGMSMLFNSANVVFRRVIKSWDDDLTKPTIRRSYDWNMQFNRDPSIKGDMQVDARGTSVLLVREIQSQNLMAIITNWPSNAPLAPYLKVREGIVKTLQTMMIPPEDLLYTQDEVDKKMREAAEQPPEVDPTIQMRMDIAKLEAETRTQIAKMQMDAEIMRMERETGMSEQEIRARYDLKSQEIGSKERLEATKIAVEDSRQKAGLDVGQGVG